MLKHLKKYLACLLICCLLLTGCGPEKEDPSVTHDDPVPSAPFNGKEPSKVPYEAPPLLEAAFHQDLAEESEGAFIDISHVSDGYVAVSATSDTRLKFQAIKEEITYTYDMPSDGTPAVFPIQSGDGNYLFRIMERVVDSKYGVRFSLTCDVKLKDEFQPFLRPSAYVNYEASSDCVKKAAELSKKASTAVDVVALVYAFVCETVTYDDEKAATVKSGYLPLPDETMNTGKGICFDYASLTAAMLRSQGIPTKVVFGYVAPNDLYHAWNMFYTEETGWVTVSFEVSKDTWNRLDLTFSANGADDTFIGNGTNYSDLYFY